MTAHGVAPTFHKHTFKFFWTCYLHYSQRRHVMYNAKMMTRITTVNTRYVE